MRTTQWRLAAVLGCGLAFGAAAAVQAETPVRALVVTGGHAYDVEPFRAIFREAAGIEPVFMEHPKAGEMYAPDKADLYDVLVFYDMPPKLPAEQLDNLVALLKQGKPVVGLHHTLAALPQWPEWRKILGGRFSFAEGVEDGVKIRKSTFHHDQEIPVRVVDPGSPITKGVSPAFTIHDETYNYFLVDRHVRPILEADHARSGKVIGWTHRYGNSPVAYIQLGHDSKAYAHPAYRKLVTNAVRWAASPQALGQVVDAAGYKPLFNGKDLTGWKGDEKLWRVRDGMLIGKSPGIRHNDFLSTTERYDDFELQLWFRMIGGQGNSGIQLRSTTLPDGHVSGYQADLGQGFWGCLYDEARRNKILEKAPPALDRVLKKDGWNHYIIRAEGDRVTLKINGVTTVDYREPDATIPRDGIISLQIHSGPAMEIQFKDIRLKKLGPE